MRTIECTKNELIKRFTANGWTELTLQMKSGDTVIITPCYYGDDTPKSDKECEWFLMDSSTIYLIGGETLDIIAEQLNNFENLKDEREKEKVSLANFYNEKIGSKSEADRLLATNLSHYIFDTWTDQSCSYDEHVDNITAEACRFFNIDTKKFHELLDIEEARSIYSDWHKDVYGRRPR